VLVIKTSLIGQEGPGIAAGVSYSSLTLFRLFRWDFLGFSRQQLLF